jgi:hypothetical protein
MNKTLLTIAILIHASTAMAETFVVCEVRIGNLLSPDGTLRAYSEQPTVLTFNNEGGLMSLRTSGCSEIREISNGDNEIILKCADSSGVISNLKVDRVTGFWEKSTIYSTGTVLSVEGLCNAQQTRRF